MIHRRPPAQRDFQEFFQATAPSVHQIILTLERLGFIQRIPGVARSIKPASAPGVPYRRASAVLLRRLAEISNGPQSSIDQNLDFPIIWYPTKSRLVGYISRSIIYIPHLLILWGMRTELTTPHEKALMLLFAELESTAAEQRDAFLGTPGAITERTNENGTRFWVHRYSDGVGRRNEDYLGTADDEAVIARIHDLRGRIEAANATLARIRILARAGFATADRKTYSTLASLHNHGLFRAGALLIGSHAFGVLLNVLGVRAVPYATEDVDIARREQLALPGIPPFLNVLRETGIEFFEVPSLNRRGHPTSYLEPGSSRLKVDLLVPSPDETYPTIKVPELNAYAQGLPYLKYVLSNSQEAPILSPHGVVMVRVPVPERYAIHKLMVSQLRGTASSKAAKDLRQAATLLEAVVERFPGAIEDALSAVPKSAGRYLRRAIPALKRHLPASAEAVWDVLPSRT